MYGNRGQTTTELIVILAFVFILITISLVSFLDINYFLSRDETIVEQVYFRSQEFGVGAIESNSSRTQLYIWSHFLENVTVHDIWFDEVSLEITDQVLIPGVVATIESTAITTSSSYFLDEQAVLQFNYTLMDSNQTFVRTYLHEKVVVEQ